MYELICLISSNLTEGKSVPLVEKIAQILKNLNGHLVYQNELGEKKLSYPVKHEKKGNYFVFGFELTTDLIKELEKRLKNISEILRYQIVKTKKREDIKKIIEKKEEKKEKIDFEKLEEKIDKILADEDKLIK